MAGLIPDASIGGANDIGHDRVPDSRDIGSDAVEPSVVSANTVIKIDGDKITIIDGADTEKKRKTSYNFDDNLAEDIDISSLSMISTDLLQGIDEDERSRSEFIANYTKGMDYLGLKMSTLGATRGRRSTAKVVHPALQWSCIKFQSGARGEMLPAAGPVKVPVDGNDTAEAQEIARDLEQDMNHALTVGMSEFYPDADRGHFYLAYGGNLFKKVYRCPVRQRPVSECVYISDLIFSNEATDLENAQRVTHRSMLSQREVQQFMAMGIYKDVSLIPPTSSDDKVRSKEQEIMGQKSSGQRPEDRQHTIYECYTFLDLTAFGIKEKGQPPINSFTQNNLLGASESHLPLPYRVTIDKDSREVLEIRRNWREGDPRFLRRKTFIHYTLIPGMTGLLGLGYLHLLGNTVQALTGLLRLMIDAGMFANFPGGVRLKGTRSDTNEINPAPGEWAMIDAVVDDIRKTLMPMPYKDPSGILLQLMQYLENQIRTISGAVEFDSGEGKTNIPVGTMMAMVEQQTQVMAAVHKRMHTCQKDELCAIKALFAEFPEDLMKLSGVSGRDWTKTGELKDIRISPRSDPNIPAQVHRIMQSGALAMLAGQAPSLYNQHEVHRRLLMNIGISDINTLLNPPNSASPPDPRVAGKQADISVKQSQIQADSQKEILAGKMRMAEMAQEAQQRDLDRASAQAISQDKVKIEAMKTQAMAEQASQDRVFDAHNGHQDRLLQMQQMNIPPYIPDNSGGVSQ